MVEEKIRKLAEFEKFRESSEIYILSAANNHNNTKIRNNMMDIKCFVKEERGLQQWEPKMKAEFPIKMNVICDGVFPAFGVAVPEFHRSEYTLAQYRENIIKPHPELALAHIFKRRFGYSIEGCIAEIADLFINGAAIKTVAVESVDVEAVLKVKATFGLQEYENVNYVLAIKRIIGMEPLPEQKIKS
ncbi:hypothetical protein ACFL9U_09685 [Thermodesulfobacteriota bacterium]